MLKTSAELPYDPTPPTNIKMKLLHPSKLRIIKNLIIISFSWYLLFSAYEGLVMLQSTLNSNRGIGVISVSVQHACACLVALLLPKYLIRKLGSKTVIIASIISQTPYVASNFYPHWILMILSSVLLGATYPLLWTSLCSYVNNLSVLYTEHLEKYQTENKQGRNASVQNNGAREQPNNYSKTPSMLQESTTARFFGFHGMVFNLSFITSNITSYFILRIGVEGAGYVKNSTCSCGASFCNDQVACFDTNLKPPSDTIRQILTTVFVVLVVLSVGLVAVCLDNVGKKEPIPFSLESLSAACKVLKNPKFFLLIPMMLCIGLEQGFFMGDYTQAYVGCSWGIHNVGLVAAAFGLTLSLSSTCSGLAVRWVGRPPVFLLTAALEVATSAMMLAWTPDADRPALIFLGAALIGAIAGTYWSQVRAFVGILFREDEEAAFGNYQFWHSLGASIAFGYSKYLCTYVKIYILLCVSTLGIIGYLLVERSHSRSKQK